jgi:trimeric autotransporter adhesin
VRGRQDLISQIRRKTAQDYSRLDELATVKDEVEGLRDTVTRLRLAVAGLGRAYSLARSALEDAGMEPPPPAAEVAGVTHDIAAFLEREAADAHRRGARGSAAGVGRKAAAVAGSGAKAAAGAMPVKKRLRGSSSAQAEAEAEEGEAAAAAAASSSSSSSSARPAVALGAAPSLLPPRGLRIQTGVTARFVGGEASSAATATPAEAEAEDFPFSPLAAAAADVTSSSSSSSSSSLISPSLAGGAAAAAAAASLDPAVVRRVASLLAGQGDGSASFSSSLSSALLSPQRQGSSRGGLPGRGPKAPNPLLLLPPKLFDDSIFFGDDARGGEGDDALGLTELRTLTTSMSFEDSSSASSSAAGLPAAARPGASLASPRGIPRLGRVSSLESETGGPSSFGPSSAPSGASSAPLGRTFSLGGLGAGVAPFGVGFIQAPPLPAAPSDASSQSSFLVLAGGDEVGAEQEDDESLARAAPSFARMSSFGSTASSDGMAQSESSGGDEEEDGESGGGGDDDDEGDVVGSSAGAGIAELQATFVRLPPARQRELLGRLLPPVLARAAGWDPRLDFRALCALVLRLPEEAGAGAGAGAGAAGGEAAGDEAGARALARLASTPTDVLVSSLLPLPSVQAVLVQAGLLAAAQQTQQGGPAGTGAAAASSAAAAAAAAASSSTSAAMSTAAVTPGGYGYLAGEPMPARAMLLAGPEGAARGAGAGGALGPGEGIA